MHISKRVLVSIFLAFVTFIYVSDCSYADNAQQIKRVEQKRIEIKNKIRSLARLERQEANKLSRNQQKLEKNQKELKQSKEEYSEKQTTISNLQDELNSYLAQYNKQSSH